MDKFSGEKMSKIIMLSGKAGSGKDKFFELASKFKDFKRFAFADSVKDIARNLFDWDGNKDNEGRNLLIKIGTILRGDIIKCGLDIHKIEHFFSQIQGQYFLDYTVYRDYTLSEIYDTLTMKFTPDKLFWAKILFNKIQRTVEPIIITDWRFENEFLYLNNFYDIKTVRVEREVKKINSYTETELDNHVFDYTIINNSSLEEYESNIKETIEEILW